MPTELYEQKLFSHEERTEEIATQNALSSIVEEKIAEVLSGYDSGYGDYFITMEIEDKLTEKLMNESEFQAQSQAYKELFNNLIKAESINYSMLRHILKKATRYRIRSLISDLFRNIELLYPVYRETIVYLKTVITQKNINRYESSLLNLWKLTYSNLNFISKWNTYLFSEPAFANLIDQEIYNSIKNIRNKSILAKARKDLLWIRDHRDDVHSLGEWDRWALLFSSISLPSEERKRWLATLNKTLDMVDESIIGKIRNE
jgi:hypothetical protein